MIAILFSCLTVYLPLITSLLPCVQYIESSFFRPIARNEKKKTICFFSFQAFDLYLPGLYGQFT